MKIAYLNCDGKHKLFSFHTHHYNTVEIDGKHYMIDGGTSYIRSSIDGTIEEGEIKDLIEDIRNVFTWGVNFDKNGKRLQFTKKETQQWCNSVEGLQFKEENIKVWKEYNSGRKIMNKPTQYNLLKDLTSSHICGILSYFNNRAFKSIEKFEDIEEIINCSGIDKQWLIFHEIFTQELDFRIKNSLI